MTGGLLFLITAAVAVMFIASMVGFQRALDAWHGDHVSDSVAWVAVSAALLVAIALVVALTLRIRMEV